MENEDIIVKTDEGAKNGQNKCPKCGATDISLNSKTGKLRCNFCRHEFDNIAFSKGKNVKELKGRVIGSGASKINKETEDVVTLKCTSCGASVVIDTKSMAQARCHWCRNTLSLNEQIPNGAIPDTVLPFKISKEEAKEEIRKFVSKRRFFANPTFKKEFKVENVMGVYLPYMIVDANTHATLVGEGEHKLRSYTEQVGDIKKTYYDAEVSSVYREYDLVIEGLTTESSKDKLDTSKDDKTNNIINAIMPFDTENCVKWDANYLKGYTSEKRDTDVLELEELTHEKLKDISRYACNETLSHYDRGVRWDSEKLDIKGERWMSSYLPVWLYSYQEKKKKKTLLHYVAVNARNKKTMGSVPVHMPKLLIVSFLVEILGLVLMLFTYNDENNWPLLFLLSGFIYFGIIYGKYRNASARHNYETETKTKMENLIKKDTYIKTLRRVTNASMVGANNKTLKGTKNNIKSINDIKSFKDVKESLESGIENPFTKNEK